MPCLFHTTYDTFTHHSLNMDNRSDNFDVVLPVLPLISNVVESLIPDFSMNDRNETLPSKEFLSDVYPHPVLYGVAFYALFLVIIGTIGNGLTILILLRPKLRQYTTMRYLTAVAIADLCSLYAWNLNLFYKHWINPYQNDLEDNSMFACRFVSFVAFVTLQLSSWYLTLVSIDRCLSIHFLFWHRQLGRASRSLYIILSVTIVIVLLNSHVLFLNGYYKDDCSPVGKKTCFTCYARSSDQHYIFPKWETIHVIIYNFIPFSIMLVSTCFIIRRSISAANTRRTLSRNQSRCPSRKGYRQRKQRQLTCILFSVIFLFVLLTTPVMIYNVFLRNRIKTRKPLKYIVHGILLCVQFTSHAINFFVYCYGASKFRDELNAFFSCFRPVKPKNHRRRVRAPDLV